MNDDIVVISGGRHFPELYRHLCKPKLNNVEPLTYLQHLTSSLHDESDFHHRLFTYLDSVVFGDTLGDFRQYYKSLGMAFYSDQMVYDLAQLSKDFMLDFYASLDDKGHLQQGSFPYVLQSFTDRALLFKRVPAS